MQSIFLLCFPPPSSTHSPTKLLSSISRIISVAHFPFFLLSLIYLPGICSDNIHVTNSQKNPNLCYFPVSDAGMAIGLIIKPTMIGSSLVEIFARTNTNPFLLDINVYTLQTAAQIFQIALLNKRAFP